MSTYKKRPDFFTTPEGVRFKHALEQMVADKTCNTRSSFSTNTELYPDHNIPFVNKHMEYIRNHPSVNPNHYLANLRLMIRVR